MVSVTTVDGARQFTRTRLGPASLATCLENTMMPALADA